MVKVIITKGLPGSGKSTWSKGLVLNNPNSYKRVNKDDLRIMIDCGNHSRDMEKLILKIRDSIIIECINSGKNVIVDDTNLSSKHENRIRQLVQGKAEVVIKDFTNVPLDECIKRDLKREKSVGEKTIKEMHKKYLLKEVEYIEDISLPRAIIVDIDGTLAKMNGRSPFDWSRVCEYFCNETIKRISNSYHHSSVGGVGRVIIFSGRDGSCREETMDWLNKHNIKYDCLFMREAGNFEKDSIIKKRMFDKNIIGKYYIDYVLDDRNQVVEMWRSLGLTCLQVADGDF